MTTSGLEDAFGHHVWASLRIIDICTSLGREQLTSPVPGTYGSILDTARHIVGSDAWYLFVLTEGRVPQIDEDTMELDDLRTVMEHHGAEWPLVIREGPDPDTIVAVQRPDGTKGHAPAGIRFAQALHHGTDHRSQICTGLTALGGEPPDIDVWAFGEVDGRVFETPSAP
jgi:uncharacterized damage-inducible protein DinB